MTYPTRPAPDPSGDHHVVPPAPSPQPSVSVSVSGHEMVDLAIVNASKLSIFRQLEKLLRDPFDTSAAEEINRSQALFGTSVHTAQRRLLDRPASS